MRNKILITTSEVKGLPIDKRFQGRVLTISKNTEEAQIVLQTNLCSSEEEAFELAVSWVNARQDFLKRAN